VETKKRVLIVDDEPKIGKIFSLKLKLAGYEVTSTTSGAEAIELVRLQSFDVMILDILMPDITGLEVLEKVRAFSQIPILIFSAKQELVETAKKMGANGSLPKPLNPDYMVEQVRNIFGEKNNQAKLS
jgi:DNA-binding response OmpR family regulator